MPWDASEIDALAADLGKASAEVAVTVRQIIAKGAVNIKKQLREEMGGSGHFGQAAASITYDLTAGADEVVAEVGPTKSGAGPLANIAYFGTSRGGGTVPDPMGALTAEGERTVAYFDKLIGGLL